MGVAGCGKSTVGEALANHFALIYVEGDALHDQSNVAKMSRGEALTDDDRWPWLQRIGEQLANSDNPTVISCSALRRVYRDHIRKHAARPVVFVHLAAAQSVIAERMARRTDHFMPVSLLTSQFETLEPLQHDEAGIAIDISQTVERVIADTVEYAEPLLV